MVAENQKALELAFGRIFRLLSRPEQDGDIADYERCRGIILDLLPAQPSEYAHDYVRDRLKGAQGDHA